MAAPYVIEDSGHAPCWDHPDIFAETLQAIIAR